MNEPTHPPRRTISRAEARPRTLALVEALRDIIKNEEAWAIAQDFLDAERADGFAEGRVERGPVYDDSALDE